VLIGRRELCGLALAIALKQALVDLQVTVADPALGRRRTMRGLGDRGGGAPAVETIRIWDSWRARRSRCRHAHHRSRLGDAVRPVSSASTGMLSSVAKFTQAVWTFLRPKPFAHMVENKPLLAALVEVQA